MHQKKFFLMSILLSSLLLEAAVDKTTCIINSNADIDWGIWGQLREESFNGKNIVYLNDNNPEDQTFYLRHTLDMNMRIGYGLEKYGCRVTEFKGSLRQRTIWGFASSTIRTTDATIKVADVVTSPHSHELPRLFMWMREGWMKIDLNAALGLGFEHKHSLTLGAFSFELGRGIALGAAYAIGPTPLGFFADGIIDQFAFGIKLSGDVLKDILKYDFYGALLQARSTSIAQTGQKILGQQIGRMNNPMRGFGKDNYLIAGRLLWTVFNDSRGTFSLEPYVLYNNDPEQQLEFPADTSSKLGTAGLAAEYEGCRLGCGFDVAFNMGSQMVKAWDRNQVQFSTNTTATVTEVNTQIVTSPNSLKPLAPFGPGSTNQNAIFTADNSGLQGVTYNGQPILNTSNPIFYNSTFRFRPAYKNKYNGQMVVADIDYWLYKKDFKVATTVGYASGDIDPNIIAQDTNYNGFIGLQEIYMGKRVKSVFLLGTVGKVKRPGVEPAYDDSIKKFSTAVGGFTNLLFWGGGFTWKPSIPCRQFHLNSNVFLYWEPSPGLKYDFTTMEDLSIPARKFLGTELNTFISANPFENLKIWGIGSVFFPDGHFTDIRGKPINKDQQAALAKLDVTGFIDDKIPNMGNDIGFTLNVGVDYTF